jgi:hypothetical protein
MSPKPRLQDLVADFAEFANDESVSEADLASLVARGGHWYGLKFLEESDRLLRKAGRAERVFLAAVNRPKPAESSAPRTVSLNQVQSLKPNNMLSGAVRKALREAGVTGTDVELYKSALAMKVGSGDRRVMDALFKLTGDAVLTNAGPGMEPHLATIRGALGDVQTAASVRRWAEEKVKADHARDPGKWRMHFGKHKDKPLEDLPESYLDWLQRAIPDFQKHFADLLSVARGKGTLRDVRFPDLSNPNVPEQYKRPDPRTFFDPATMTRRFRDSLREVSFVRFEDYSGVRAADVPARVRARIGRFMQAAVREDFVQKFNEFVSRPEVRQRLEQWLERKARNDEPGGWVTGEQERDALASMRKAYRSLTVQGKKIHPDEARLTELREWDESEPFMGSLRPFGDPTRGRTVTGTGTGHVHHAASKGRQHLALPTSMEVFRAKHFEGEVLEPGVPLHMGSQLEKKMRRSTVGRSDEVLTWDRLLRAAELIEDAHARGSAASAEEQVSAALGSVGGEAFLRQSNHPYARELLKLADKARNMIRARGRVAWQGGGTPPQPGANWRVYRREK